MNLLRWSGRQQVTAELAEQEFSVVLRQLGAAQQEVEELNAALTDLEVELVGVEEELGYRKTDLAEVAMIASSAVSTQASPQQHVVIFYDALMAILGIAKMKAVEK